MNVILEQGKIILASTNIKDKAFLEQIKNVEFLTSGSRRDPKSGIEEKFVILSPSNQTKQIQPEEQTIIQEVKAEKEIPDILSPLTNIINKLQELIDKETENKELREKQITTMEKNIEWLSEETKEILNSYKAKVKKFEQKNSLY